MQCFVLSERKENRFMSEKNMKVKCFGAEKNYNDKLSYTEILKKNHLTPIQICEDILKII